MDSVTGQGRLIVALDVPTIDEALGLVERLKNVSFFKVGLQLFMTGDLPRLLTSLREKQVFVDLKVPGDIANTISSVMEMCVRMQIRFLTLSESMPLPAIAVAKETRDAKRTEYPKLLTVPFLSSMNAEDLRAMTGSADLDAYVVGRAKDALKAGVDGVIASGPQIGVCRRALGDSVIIVSPGIRPSGSSTDDHKRHTTPSEAIQLGADYLVVGRPITKSPEPFRVAESIIHEIDDALEARGHDHQGHITSTLHA